MDPIDELLERLVPGGRAFPWAEDESKAGAFVLYIEKGPRGDKSGDCRFGFLDTFRPKGDANRLAGIQPQVGDTPKFRKHPFENGPIPIPVRDDGRYVISEGSIERARDSLHHHSQKDVYTHGKKEGRQGATLPNPPLQGEAFKVCATYPNMTSIIMVHRLDEIHGIGGEAQGFETRKEEGVGDGGESSFKVKQNQGSMFMLKRDCHGYPINIDDVMHHVPALQEASLELGDPRLQHGFPCQPDRAGNQSVVDVAYVQGSCGFSFVKCLPLFGNARRFFGKATQNRFIEGMAFLIRHEFEGISEGLEGMG